MQLPILGTDIPDCVAGNKALGFLCERQGSSTATTTGSCVSCFSLSQVLGLYWCCESGLTRAGLA